MTTGTLQERMMTISRYFTREKWKNETGIFQYPRGKRRTDAVVEALEIAFEPTEFELKKELNLRGDDVVGNVYIVSVPAEDTFGGYFYLVLTCTDHVFVVQKLPEKATEMLNLVETEDTHAAASDNSATSDMVETSELSESEKTDIDSVKVANKNSEDVVASASEETEKVSENLEVLKKEVEDALKDNQLFLLRRYTVCLFWIKNLYCYERAHVSDSIHGIFHSNPLLDNGKGQHFVRYPLSQGKM